MDQKIFTTQEAARLLSVGQSTLKRWADEGIVESYRTVGGHRRFTHTALERFISERQSTAETKSDVLVDSWLELLLSSNDNFSLPGQLLLQRSHSGSWWRTCDLLGEVLMALGKRWERGEISVIDEHLASERLARAITWIIQTIPTPPTAPRCVLVTAEGDEHTLGLSLANLCCAEAGWSVLWLGRATPHEFLAQRVSQGGLSMVAVSASCGSKDALALERQCQRLEALCSAQGITLVLGGGGAWPEGPIYAHRVNSMEEFHLLLREALEKQSYSEVG